MLIKCPECQGAVSDQAAACPHCGNPVKSKEQKDPFSSLPKCPYCGSPFIVPMDAGSRGRIFGGGGFLKAFSGTKECKACGKVW